MALTMTLTMPLIYSSERVDMLKKSKKINKTLKGTKKHWRKVKRVINTLKGNKSMLKESKMSSKMLKWSKKNSEGK